MTLGLIFFAVLPFLAYLVSKEATGATLLVSVKKAPRDIHQMPNVPQSEGKCSGMSGTPKI